MPQSAVHIMCTRLDVSGQQSVDIISMAEKKTTTADVFDAFGGPAEFGRVIGVSTRHAAGMRARGSIPPRYWPVIAEAARRRKIAGITLAILAATRQ